MPKSNVWEKKKQLSGYGSSTEQWRMEKIWENTKKSNNANDNLSALNS